MPPVSFRVSTLNNTARHHGLNTTITTTNRGMAVRTCGYEVHYHTNAIVPMCRNVLTVLVGGA